MRLFTFAKPLAGVLERLTLFWVMVMVGMWVNVVGAGQDVLLGGGKDALLYTAPDRSWADCL